MITIYHNPRCSKSREGLAILQASTKDFEVIKYLEDNLDKNQIKSLLGKLKIKPMDLIRKNEAIWKSDFKNKVLSDEQIIDAMVNHPKLIERPIAVNKDKAVVGRPPESIITII